jgi:hypothetical protein
LNRNPVQALCTEGEPPGQGTTHGTNPVTGVDQYAIDRADGSQELREGSWAEARDLALRAGRDDGLAFTRWYRRS